MAKRKDKDAAQPPAEAESPGKGGAEGLRETAEDASFRSWIFDKFTGLERMSAEEYKAMAKEAVRRRGLKW
ncbi:MAG: hypothetical protein LBR22_08885 [Desulfovibrio sp.]|jgi:hypothetical protein|nr:hypothetical protein [Desulfovibrio sp.]